MSPGFPQAWTLLAEAHIELDEENEAKGALLSVNLNRRGAITSREVDAEPISPTPKTIEISMF